MNYIVTQIYTRKTGENDFFEFGQKNSKLKFVVKS